MTWIALATLLLAVCSRVTCSGAGRSPLKESAAKSPADETRSPRQDCSSPSEDCTTVATLFSEGIPIDTDPSLVNQYLDTFCTTDCIEYAECRQLRSRGLFIYAGSNLRGTYCSQNGDSYCFTAFLSGLDDGTLSNTAYCGISGGCDTDPFLSNVDCRAELETIASSFGCCVNSPPLTTPISPSKYAQCGVTTTQATCPISLDGSSSAVVTCVSFGLLLVMTTAAALINRLLL